MTQGNDVYVQREGDIKGTCHANCEMAEFPLLHLVVGSGQENLAMTQSHLAINLPAFSVPKSKVGCFP